MRAVDHSVANNVNQAMKVESSRAPYLVPLSVLVIMLLLTLVAGVYRLDINPALDRLIQALSLPLFLFLCVSISGGVFAVLLHFTHTRELLIQELTRVRARLEEQQRELLNRNKDLLSGVSERNTDLADKVEELERSRSAMVSILEDLTESRDSIEEARAYDNAILASLGDGLVVMDPSYVVTRMNDAAFALNGMSSDTPVVGKPVAELFDLIDEADRSLTTEERPGTKLLAQGAAAKQMRINTLRLRRKDGAIINVDLNYSPVIKSGKLLAIVVIVRDITEEVRASRAKSEFVSLASHQLRTPLTAIGWYSELLLSDHSAKLDEEAREHLREIYLSNRRMVELVDSLLNVSRIELGSFSIEPKDIDVATIISEQLEVFRSLREEKNLDVRSEIQEKMPPFYADPKLLGIVIQNIISNALKYTPLNGTIRIHCTRDSEQLTFSVTDSGIGIPKSELGSKLFQKMYRASNARVMQAEGTGLGLYLVKSIIDDVGGTIDVQSEEGKGSTFTVKFPASGMKKREGSRVLIASSKPAAPAGWR